MNLRQFTTEVQERHKRYRYRRYPVLFTAANDHNPRVLENCPDCEGTGKIRTENRNTFTFTVCESCSGSGTTGRIVPYFRNDHPALTVAVDADGWLRCPHCGKYFTIHDAERWTGLRHKTCGQKLLVVQKQGEKRAQNSPS